MSPEQRKRLEERREFNRVRVAARHLREQAEPAFSALSEANEDFRLYRLTEEPKWAPDWIPQGWGRMHWHRLDDVHCTPSSLCPEELAPLVIAALSERMRADDRLLIGSQFWFEMTLAAFERHVLAIFEALWRRAYIASPPAQWMMELDGHMAWWKDG